MVDISF